MNEKIEDIMNWPGYLVNSRPLISKSKWHKVPIKIRQGAYKEIMGAGLIAYHKRQKEEYEKWLKAKT